jgi:acylphosphatase
MGERRTVRVRILGRVQGVWYRGWAEDEAGRLGLDGWVRNRADGSVEAVLSGAPDRVREMIGLCRHGPPAARVERIEETAEPDPPEPGFRTLPTR